ncbi:MAG TPA: metal ABC transporter substrate-binding protein [Bacteroidia bacterium]|nr:metal ABC transporter substrate-binding protein [Bacteroidia bacterium]
MRIFRLSLICAAFVASAAFTSAKDKIVVESTNYPLHYFAQRIATDAFELNYRIDPEVDPAFWKPTKTEITALQEADLVIRNGADYEKWLKRVSLRTATQLDTSKAFSDAFIETEGKEHMHGDGTVHSHAGTSFTTWIDFSQAAKQAEAIARRFKNLRPEDADEIGKRLGSLLADLATLDERMKAFGKAWGEKPLVASHPIYQYLARAYGLKIEALEWEPEMEMKDSDLADLKKLLARHPAQWMIWEDEPSEGNAAAIDALGVKSVFFSPCANQPAEGDWLAVMKANLERLEALNK